VECGRARIIFTGLWPATVQLKSWPMISIKSTAQRTLIAVRAALIPGPLAFGPFTTYGKPPKLATNRAKIAKICSVSVLHFVAFAHAATSAKSINLNFYCHTCHINSLIRLNFWAKCVVCSHG